jgi:hypothetical protein
MLNISPIHFFSALFVGFLIVYALAPKPKIIVKYPTLDNVGKTLYSDDNGVCYRYQKVDSKCS